MNGITHNMAAYRHMMSFMAAQSVRIFDREYLLVAIGNHNHFLSRFNALFRAFRGFGVRPLGRAL
jgi:hypothetical protein